MEVAHALVRDRRFALDYAFDVQEPALSALRAKLAPEVWDARVAEAQAHLATIEAVEAAIVREGNESKAIREHGGGIDRATYRRLRGHYEQEGFAGLIDQRPPPPAAALKVTPTIRSVICVLREMDAHLAVERIAEVVERRCGEKVSTTVIKRVLAEEGLNRPRGGGVHPSALRSRAPQPAAEVERLVFAGATLLLAMDEQVGLSREMAEAIQAAATVVAEAPEVEPVPEADGARDERGRFTAVYNEANAREDAALGPAFRSVAQKRREVDLGARRLAGEGAGTIQRKCQALFALPYLADNGKTVEVDDYRAHHGLAEACGHGYEGETLERFLRDAKYLGLADPLMEFHAGFWLRHEPRVKGEEAPAAFFIYVDGSTKALWTDKFTKAGKVTSNGRIMPCLDQVLVHTGTGTPIFWQTVSGHASLVTHLPVVLDEVEAKVGNGWCADRIVVMDGEGCAVGLMRRLKDAERDFITILKPSRIPKLSEVRGLSEWAPYREGDEIAEGYVTLRDSKDGTSFDVRIVLVRRLRAGQTSCLVTSVDAETLTAAEVADGYYGRWPQQELRFKTFGTAHFKGVKGYGKELVTNVAVVTELEKLQARRPKLLTRIERQGAAVKTAKKALSQQRLALNAAKARRRRHDERVADELLVAQPDPIAVWDQVEVIKAERDRHAAAMAGVEEAEAAHQAAAAKLAETRASLPKLDARIAELESRREIHRADTELDRIVTVYKLGFVLLCELVLREWFGGTRISLATFMRQVLTLPGTRTVEGFQEHVKLACPPNPEVREMLEAACKHVNGLKLRRNGLVLRLAVEPPPAGRNR